MTIWEQIEELAETEKELIWLMLHPRHRKKHPLILAIFFNNKLSNMPTTSLTLVDKNVHTGVLSVIDSNTGAVIPGTISNVAETVSDPTVDTAVTDPSNANEVYVQAVANTGSATVGVTADFVSTDGTINVKGLSLTLPVTNNIPVTPPPPPPPTPQLVIDIS